MDWIEKIEANCPFYMGERYQKIRCEGFNEDNRVHMVFRDALNKAGWQMTYCYTHRYAACPIAKALENQFWESHGGDCPEIPVSGTIGTSSTAGTKARP